MTKGVNDITGCKEGACMTKVLVLLQGGQYRLTGTSHEQSKDEDRGRNPAPPPAVARMIVLCIVVGWSRSTKGDLGGNVHPRHGASRSVVRNHGGDRGVLRHVLSFPLPLKPAKGT